MRNKRILIVEPEADFALQMAAVLHQDGFATTIAHSAAEALREVDERRPDLLLLRAELPEQNGFSLCARLRRDPAHGDLPIVIASSESSPEALAEHASNAQHAASAYLSVPFAMDDLRATVAWLAPAPEGEVDEPEEIEAEEILDVEPVDPDADPLAELADAGEGGPSDAETVEAAVQGVSLDDDEIGATFDEALLGEGPREAPAPTAEVPVAFAPKPPRIPRRERRSAITEEDRIFLDRTFGTIADRKAELLTEARAGVRSSSRSAARNSPGAIATSAA